MHTTLDAGVPEGNVDITTYLGGEMGNSIEVNQETITSVHPNSPFEYAVKSAFPSLARLESDVGRCS